jgi:hypothetical protein
MVLAGAATAYPFEGGRDPAGSADGIGKHRPADNSGFMKLTKDQRLAVLVLVAVFLFNVYRFMPVFSHSHG